jgi:hypothetical protein
LVNLLYRRVYKLASAVGAEAGASGGSIGVLKTLVAPTALAIPTRVSWRMKAKQRSVRGNQKHQPEHTGASRYPLQAQLTFAPPCTTGRTRRQAAHRANPKQAGRPPGAVSVRRSGWHATGRGRRCGMPALHRGALSLTAGRHPAARPQASRLYSREGNMPMTAVSGDLLTTRNATIDDLAREGSRSSGCRADFFCLRA